MRGEAVLGIRERSCWVREVERGGWGRERKGAGEGAMMMGFCLVLRDGRGGLG